MQKTDFSKYKEIVYYGLALAALLLVLRFLEIRYLVFAHGFEIYTAISAVLFMALGIWLAIKLFKPKTIVVEKEKPLEFNFDASACEAMGISKRELEVLQLMAQGLSNGEIAERLFVSLPTVKTHGARLFEKLDVKRRTQAVEKGKRLRLIP